MALEKILEKNRLVTGEKSDNVIYEVIKRQDLVGAFRDALTESFAEIIAELHKIADLYSAIANPALWTWDYASRWDYDLWW